LKKVVNLINENKPDLILFTGDLLDQTILEPQPFQAVLKELHAHVGKYAIHGNHEFYAGIDFSDAFIKNSDITLLTNQLVLPHEAIELIGIDDRNSQNYLSNNLIPQLNNQSKPENKFRILLNHKPTLFLEAAEKGIDLQLSGHTHNGQFFPFNVLVRLFFRFKYGLYQHQDAVLYTSCGSGTWGPPWRLFSSSEIVLFDITIKNKD
jgi:predicted MPP superfamily phosphohydrolase